MNYVTFGGVTVGLCLLAWHLTTWYPGYKALRSSPLDHAGRLMPFLVAWCYGCLTTLGIGGLIGWISGMALWISNWIGDVALFWGVGNEMGMVAHGGTVIPLGPTGAAFVLIATVVFLAAVKKSRYSSELKAGAWCGICLGTSAGVAGLAAAPLAQAAMWIGDAVYGAFQ